MKRESFNKGSFVIPLILFLIVLSFSRAASQTQQNILMVELYEWGIDLSTASLPPGPANIFVTNVGTRPHNFHIEGQETSLSFPNDLPVGDTLTMQMDLQGGEYLISDPTADYAGRGMQVTLRVMGGDQQTTTPQQAQPTQTSSDQQNGEPTQAAQATVTATETGATQAAGAIAQQASPSPGEQSEGGGQSGEQLAQQGQEIFSGNCAQCHGQNGEGQVGPALAGNDFVTQEDPAPVVDAVAHGRGQMPAFEGQLSNEEIAAVVSFIRGAWGNDALPVTTEETGNGVNGAEGQSGDQAAQEVTVELTVQNNSFSQEAISVPAGARVVMTFTNNDSRPHNFSLYRSPSALEAIFLGRIVSGPDQSVTYEFTAPSEPGEYYFQCDVHPYMNGTFTVEN